MNIERKTFDCERALYGTDDAKVTDSVFIKGESPVKECKNIDFERCSFRWKYPIWYSENLTFDNCNLFEDARAAAWYIKNIKFENSIVRAVKTFRRCSDVKLKNVTFSDAKETLWECDNVEIENVTAKGDYFGMNSHDMKIENLTLDGNYSFDGCRNIEVRNSRILSRDTFWNSENITVYDSSISGEYLGWNSKNITFVNCTIESLQGLCYIQNLKMINCRLVDTTFAFEYSSVDAEIIGEIGSVFNPESGTIKADRIGELIIEKDLVDPGKTKIICKDIVKECDEPDWT